MSNIKQYKKLVYDSYMYYVQSISKQQNISMDIARKEANKYILELAEIDLENIEKYLERLEKITNMPTQLELIKKALTLIRKSNTFK